MIKAIGVLLKFAHITATVSLMNLEYLLATLEMNSGKYLELKEAVYKEYDEAVAEWELFGKQE